MEAAAGAEIATEELHRIGEIAKQVGLSLRTVRYYEEMGLLSPLKRTEGGFRLYGPEHLDQLKLIKQMKPLGLSIEEMRALLGARAELASGTSAGKRAEARDRLERFAELAGQRCAELRRQLRSAESFARRIRDEATGGD